MLTSVKNLNKAITKVMDDVQIATADKVYIFVKEFVRDEESFNTSFEEFKKSLKQDISCPLVDSKKTTAEKKKSRLPSAYNIFIGEKIKALKVDFPESDGKALMKLAIGQWKERAAAVAAEPTAASA